MTPGNDTGRTQAARLAHRLAGLHFDAVYSSALARSRETADMVRGSVPLTALDGLNERRPGAFEGRRIDASTPVAAAEYARRSYSREKARYSASGARTSQLPTTTSTSI